MTLRNSTCRMKISPTGLVVLAGALFASTGALAGDTKETVPACDAPKSPAAAEPAGKTAPRMIVVRDPDTGKLRAPTAKEIEALRAAGAAIKPAFSKGVRTTTVETLPSGRRRAQLGPEYFRYSVVRKNADGTLSEECVPASKVGEALKAPAPAAKPAAEEK